AIKIAPGYRQPVVHVLDASRAVGVVSSLLSPEMKPGFVEQNQALQDGLREQHSARKQEQRILPIDEARRLRARIDWSNGHIARPSFTGIRTLEEFPLAELVPYID